MRNLVAKGCGIPVLQRRIDKAQDGGRRAEGVLELQALKPLFDCLESLAKPGVLFVKSRNIGTLKRIDRLLLVTHHEDRPGLIACTKSRRKLGGQQFDHPPLGRACVLRLIDQNMVDPAVQPIKHPGRDRRLSDQFGRLRDQVVKIQPPPFGLARLI